MEEPTKVDQFFTNLFAFIGVFATIWFISGLSCN
jgi:hypothetical protein